MKTDAIRIVISPELKKAFKEKCDKNSQTMSKLILKFIESQVKEGEK